MIMSDPPTLFIGTLWQSLLNKIIDITVHILLLDSKLSEFQ